MGVALVRDDERDDFEDLLGSGGIFRKVLRANPDGALVGAWCYSVCVVTVRVCLSRKGECDTTLHAFVTRRVAVD